MDDFSNQNLSLIQLPATELSNISIILIRFSPSKNQLDICFRLLFFLAVVSQPAGMINERK